MCKLPKNHKTKNFHKNSLNSIDTVTNSKGDPTISRFLSPDIFIQSPTNSQSYNRYAYVWNNPLKYTDPTGYELGDEDFGGDIGSAGYDGYDAGEASDNQADENNNEDNGYDSDSDGNYNSVQAHKDLEAANERIRQEAEKARLQAIEDAKYKQDTKKINNENKQSIISRIYNGFTRDFSKMYAQETPRRLLNVAVGVAVAPLTVVGTTKILDVSANALRSNPEAVGNGLMFVESGLPYGTPAPTFIGAAGYMAGKIYDWLNK